MNTEDRFVDILLLIIIIAGIVLKLVGVITVSWWIIFSPILLCLAIGVLFTIVAMAMLCISLIKENMKKNV